MASAVCSCCSRNHGSNSASPHATPTSTHPKTPSSSTPTITLHQFLPLHSAPSETLQILKSKTCTSHSAHSAERLKRLIKSRDCGARSRARQQAYQNQLETKLVLLMEENSTLRRQVEELKIRLKCGAAPPKMCSLYRTSTSPF